MKTKTLITVGSALLLTATITRAAHVWEDPSGWWSGHLSYEVGPKYTAEEFSLDLFASYWWPGNVRQLRNEIQRAVALAPSGGTIAPGTLSPALSGAAEGETLLPGGRYRRTSLAAAVEYIE